MRVHIEIVVEPKPALRIVELRTRRSVGTVSDSSIRYRRSSAGKQLPDLRALERDLRALAKLPPSGLQPTICSLIQALTNLGTRAVAGLAYNL